jgi:hypothetical protein
MAGFRIGDGRKESICTFFAVYRTDPEDLAHRGKYYITELNLPAFFLCSFFFFLFFEVSRLELRAYTLSHSTSPFCVRYFQDRVSCTICPGWFQTVILLISASWVARIIGVSHQRQPPAVFCLFVCSVLFWNRDSLNYSYWPLAGIIGVQPHASFSTCFCYHYLASL